MAITFNFTVEQVNDFIDSNYRTNKEGLIDSIDFCKTAKALREFILDQAADLNNFSRFLNPSSEEVEIYRYNLLYFKRVKMQVIESNENSLEIYFNNKLKYNITSEENQWFIKQPMLNEKLTVGRVDELFREFLLLCAVKE